MRATTRSFANCCLFALLLLIWQSPEIKIKSQRREEINNHTEFDNVAITLFDYIQSVDKCTEKIIIDII
jgi:hypothetical protein